MPDALTLSTRRGFVVGASTLALLATARGAFAATPAQVAQAEDILRKTSVAPPMAPPALSMAVAGPNGAVWSGAVGKANLELDVAATPAHSFRIGSVSKVVTAAAAARLISRGLLDLDAPIATWLPELPTQHRATTLRQLFTHRGGVRHYASRDLDPRTPGGAIYQRVYADTKAVLAAFVDDPLIAPPGSRIAYSSFGYTLASAARRRWPTRTSTR